MNWVDFKDLKIVEVVNVVVIFVEWIIKKFGEIDLWFILIFLCGGSFFDDVKVGKFDEFDFIVKVERFCFVCDVFELWFLKCKKGFVYLVVKDVGFI